ncbi:MAG: hypothetical protein ACI4W6_01925 [Acutalibacteraceae bacterium]
MQYSFPFGLYQRAVRAEKRQSATGARAAKPHTLRCFGSAKNKTAGFVGAPPRLFPVPTDRKAQTANYIKGQISLTALAVNQETPGEGFLRYLKHWDFAVCGRRQAFLKKSLSKKLFSYFHLVSAAALL